MKTNALIAAIALTALGLSAAGARADDTPAPAPAELVYMSQLPSPAALMKTAAAQGITVTKIDQTSVQTLVTYKYPDGRLNTVSYELLPAAESASAQAAPAPTVVSVPVPTAAPATTVVYQTTAPDPYYSPYYAAYAPGYYPWGWYAPVGISLGFGFGHGYYHGGYHGGRWR